MKNKLHPGRLLLVFATLLASLGMVIATGAGFNRIALGAETGTHPALQGLEPTPPAGGPWVVRAYFTEREQVNRVAERMEPWEVHYDQGYIVLEVDAAGYQWLLDLGFQVVLDPSLTAQLHQPLVALPGQTTGIPNYPCYRTVEETYAAAQQIASNYPNLATWIDIGESWKKTALGPGSGYDMMVLRLTNAQIPGPKPKLFVLSSIHAREYAPAELNTRFAEYLVSHYASDPDVSWLLDYHEVHLLLQANPDGRKLAETGLLWRKNTNNNGCPIPSKIGIDLNRNFEFNWDCCSGSSSYACDETYHGPSPASEPETEAIQNYIRSIYPDQRADPLSSPAPADASGVFIDLHSYGKLVLWPWGFTSSLPPNNASLRTLGRKFAYFNGYTPEQAIELYPTDGTTDDFAYGELGVAGYAFEVGTDFFQSCSTFETIILPDNLSALLYAAKVVRTPYQTPAGPDSLSVTITPSILTEGSLTTLSATIDDRRYAGGESTQDIAAAEFYIDVPAWITVTTPISHSLAALDGSFDEGEEATSATIDTKGMDIGRHRIFVRGRDSDGNWGPFSATFLMIIENPVYLPFLSR